MDDTSSFFIKDIAMFGGFPTQEKVQEFEKLGVRYFVDLTLGNERSTTPYNTQYTYLNFPIRDRSIPTDRVAFSRLILNVGKIIREIDRGEMIYIHCKGGHGRSGILVACILCYLYRIPPQKALELTTKYHSNRKKMREKWRKIGSPQTYTQKNFVIKMFSPIYFYRANKRGVSTGFSNFSLHPVSIPNLGSFPTSEAAFQAFKEPSNSSYVQSQENTSTPYEAKILGRKCKLRSDWDAVKDKIMFTVLEHKFQQNEDIRGNLLHSCLRPLVEHTANDKYWADGGNGSGRNMLGKLLEKLRYKFLTEEKVNIVQVSG